ncbi:unnamed protein product [Cochlearia groenlandica]
MVYIVDTNKPNLMENIEMQEQDVPYGVAKTNRFDTKSVEEDKTFTLGESSTPHVADESGKKWKTWLLNDSEVREVDEIGTLEDQKAFIKEVEAFHKKNLLEFKAPKFYGKPLNCLKLWRVVMKLGGYDLVTKSKLWSQVGESFHPPKTCTTVSWTFRIFYEKALIEYEKYLRQNGDLNLHASAVISSSRLEKEASSQKRTCRAKRAAAARAMQNWQSHIILNEPEEVIEPNVKDKGTNSNPKRMKLIHNGVEKHNTPTSMNLVSSHETNKQLTTKIVDIGPPAKWVKINVIETKESFEVYAMVPGFFRDEIRIQSDPSGRLVIAGQPQHLNNPWGITSFEKIVNFPVRIDHLRTSSVLRMHGRLHVRVPFEK